MNTLVLALIAAGILISGLIISPVLMRQSHVAQAQAQAQAPTTRPGSINSNFGVCSPGSITKSVTLYAQGKTLQVAPDNKLTPGGVMYDADVFGTTPTNGAIPGPLISLTQGQNLEVTLVNTDTEIHSLDFHMGYGTDQANSGPIQGTTDPAHPNSHTWRICNPAPGAWFYHCSGNMLNGIWRHIANGMYGGVVVHPLSEIEYQNPLKLPTREFYMVFGQLFTNNVYGVGIPASGTGEFDFTKFYNDQPDLILTNGMAFKYVPHIGDPTQPLCTTLGQEDCQLNLNPDPSVKLFKVLPGELTRWYIFNAGPNDGVAFHFIGTYQDDYHGFDPNPALLWNQQLNKGAGGWETCCRDARTGISYGHLIRQDMNDQVNWIPPASGQIIQAKFPLIDPTFKNSHNPTSQSFNARSQDNLVSLYVGVDHNMNHVIKGGAFAVVAVPGPIIPPLSLYEPPGTWVPPIDPLNHFPRCVTSDQQGQRVCPVIPLVAVANATK
jgi:nitrite reductase (NO-forming)